MAFISLVLLSGLTVEAAICILSSKEGSFRSFNLSFETLHVSFVLLAAFLRMNPGKITDLAKAISSVREECDRSAESGGGDRALRIIRRREADFVFLLLSTPSFITIAYKGKVSLTGKNKHNGHLHLGKELLISIGNHMRPSTIED